MNTRKWITYFAFVPPCFYRYKRSTNFICSIVVKSIVTIAAIFLLSHNASAGLVFDNENIHTYYDNEMTTIPLKQAGVPIGDVIWLKRKNNKIRAKYFAAGDAVGSFNTWKKNKVLVAVCSGAFTQDYNNPLGVTVDNGVIVNRNRDHTMDGLVVVYDSGGIVVSDIEQRYLNVNDGTMPIKLDILDATDFSKMLNWAENAPATIFQTQLLAYGGALRLDPTLANNKGKRERRILALVKDNRNGEVSHLIFNIPVDVFLGSISDEILTLLQNTNLNVEAMVNLDTGDFNILETYGNGSRKDMPKGTISYDNAVNLLVYYYVQ